MAIPSPQLDLPAGLAGGADAWDRPQASVILLEEFFEAAVGPLQTLTPARLDNAQTFFAATVANGSMVPAQLELDGLPIALDGLPLQLLVFQASGAAQTLTPARLDNAQTFFAPTVTPGAVTLTPARVNNAQTFFAPTVTPGVVTLTPVRLNNANTFFAPVVVLGGGLQTLLPARFDNAQTFFAPTVTPGVVTLTPVRLNNAQTFFAPTVTPGVVTLTPARLDNAQTFFAPAVTPGVVTLTPARVDNVNAFFAPLVTISDLPLVWAPGLRLVAPAANVVAIVQAAPVVAVVPFHGVTAVVPYPGDDMQIIKSFEHYAPDRQTYRLDFAAKYLPGVGDTAGVLLAFQADTGITATPEVAVGQPVPSGVVRFRVQDLTGPGPWRVAAQISTAGGDRRTGIVEFTLEPAVVFV
jgi:hypothetical protein